MDDRRLSHDRDLPTDAVEDLTDEDRGVAAAAPS
jgi:hypothetical protein